MDMRLAVAAALVVAQLAPAIAPAPAHAEQAAAVATALPQSLVRFDTASPGVVTVRAISGLGANESVVGIDLRPATGEVYALTVATGSAANSVVHSYAIDPDTGAATPVGATAAALAGAGDVPSGVDFNPNVDRIRLVNTNDENARLNPTNGSLAGDDTDLTPAITAAVIAGAYDRNVVDTAPTTLYGINRSTSRLVVQGGIDGVPSPNLGAITSIGPLGVTLAGTSDAGFDVAANGTAYAALTASADGRTRLYTIDLGTGSATPLGELPFELRSLTILPPPPPPPPPPPDTVPPAGLVDVGERPRLRTLQDPGLVLSFSCNEPCTASAALAARETVVARGEGTLSGAGVGQLTLSPLADAARILRRARRAGRLRGVLTVTFTDGAANTSTQERRLDLRR